MVWVLISIKKIKQYVKSVLNLSSLNTPILNPICILFMLHRVKYLKQKDRMIQYHSIPVWCVKRKIASVYLVKFGDNLHRVGVLRMSIHLENNQHVWQNGIESKIKRRGSVCEARVPFELCYGFAHIMPEKDRREFICRNE